ncbi:phage repressor protein [bacterium]|nr:MAG: phage repressor protein [bacterium]
MEKGKVEVLRGHEAYKSRLAAGENVTRRETGNSMVPKIRSREEIEYIPLKGPEEIEEGDIVWCKVKGNHFTHLVKAKKREGDVWRFQIGNNKGGVNGWIGFENIFAKAISAGGRAL